MENLFLALDLLAILAFLLSWIIPSFFVKLFKNTLLKWQIRTVFGVSAITFFILFGITAPPVEKKESQIQQQKEVAQTTNEASDQMQKTQIEQKEESSAHVEDTMNSQKDLQVTNSSQTNNTQEKQAGSNDNKKDNNNSTNEFVPIPGDIVLLKYDKDTDEKIYITDTLENYDKLVKSYPIKDNEARYELILNGNITAVKNGTKARLLDLVEKNGAEKVRILEGEYYNTVGYVPRTLMKKPD